MSRGQSLENLRRAGWVWQLSTQDFLEMVHVQAYYFQVRFFPRLSWKILDVPAGAAFITCDRPVVWGVEGNWETPPAALRHPRAEPSHRSHAPGRYLASTHFTIALDLLIQTASTPLWPRQLMPGLPAHRRPWCHQRFAGGSRH